MTDETKPPTGEPEPGSPEWLLAQLSGGRIDSRRERREAEAALEAAGLPIPDATGEAPAIPPTPAPPAEERPRARFSWETGTLEAVNADHATDAAADAASAAATSSATEPPVQPTPAAPEPEASPEPASPFASLFAAEQPAPQAPAAPAPALPVEPGAERSAGVQSSAGEPEPQAEPVIPFMWNLAPTNEPDPAVNPRAEIPEPSFNEPDFPFPSAAPLVVPRPARPLITEAPVADAVPSGPAAAAPIEPQAAAPIDPLAPAAEQAEPAKQPAPVAEPAAQAPSAAPAEPAPSAEPAPAPPQSAAPAFPFSFVAEPALPVPPPPPAAPAADAPAPAPLPPGTTAHEFDPFAQDIFGSRRAPVTPVPSLDEFTIPDESTPAQASAPAPDSPSETQPAADAAPGPETDGETHVTSDWSDIADMLGAHPQTVDTAIVSPMPPVGEILPSFDAVLPRGLGQAPGQGRGATPPPARPANAPVEHGRERSPLNRWLVIAAAILLAILIGIALFALGRSIAAGRDQAPAAATHTSTPSPKATTPTPTPSPTQTPDQAIAGTGPLAPGQSYQWDQLRGGECIEPFSSPWAQAFDVVDCNAQHAAQLVYTAPFASDPSAPFPGEQAIASQIGLLCSKPGVIDLHAAAAYNDVQVVAAYPVNADQWNSGQRNYFCFVTRSTGQQFSSSIAGPGPTQ